MAKVIIYTTPTCSFCHKAKEFFDKNNIKYEEKDVTINDQTLAEMVKKSGQMGVPVIDVDGQIVVGFDQPALVNLLKSKA
ncbi:MAG: glutathione S-transferase N-terminal domain-containing protein [Patescibacteria group bacterium]|nr:glutathione S-transferase N-terminal domain-containing protein [Patescibacteria group bacterium]